MNREQKNIASVEALSMAIRPLLAGQPPDIVGAVLSDLVSVFIVGCHPDLREEMITLHVDLVRNLVPQTERELFPHGWGRVDDES